MIVFALLVTGACCAMAFFFAARGVWGISPGFDRRTIEVIGLAGAFATYSLAGPILLVAACSERAEPMRPASVVALMALALIWTGALGIVALESGRALL